MKLLDKIALNSLIKTITNFILSLIKIFQIDKTNEPIPPSRRRPLKDLLDRLKNK